MFEDDFVSADPPRQIADRGFAHALAVDENFRPRLRIDAEHAVRHIDLRRRRFSGRHFDHSAEGQPQRFVLELDVVIAGGEHQPIGFAGPNHLSALAQLQRHR